MEDGDPIIPKYGPKALPAPPTVEEAATAFTDSIKTQRAKKQALADAIKAQEQCDKELAVAASDTQAKRAALEEACTREGLDHGAAPSED